MISEGYVAQKEVSKANTNSRKDKNGNYIY